MACSHHVERDAVRKTETITTSDFEGESRRHAKTVTARAKAFSKAIERWLKKEARKKVRVMIRDIRQFGPEGMRIVRKADDDEWDEERLLKIFALYGVRQISDSGAALAGAAWFLAPTVRDTYLLEKRVLIQRLSLTLEKEMQKSVGTALGTWYINEPNLTVGQISERLRKWLTVSSAADTPYELKPLGKKFTSWGLGARARMIARTETNQARNRGRLEAGNILGTQYWMWLAETDGLSGDRQHDALDRQVRQTGEAFVNPATGAVLEYPGDAGAEASEIINCRCSIRPITADQAKQFGV